jgi:cyclophilin family peptidyl-prolyl cis-trans isomerase
MIQGGGYTADMKEKASKPAIKNEAGNGLKNLRGTLAMARTMDIDSATNQFFINLVNNAFLDHRDNTADGFGYCVFGMVTSGMEAVDAIANSPTGVSRGMGDVPRETITILSVRRL